MMMLSKCVYKLFLFILSFFFFDGGWEIDINLIVDLDCMSFFKWELLYEND